MSGHWITTANARPEDGALCEVITEGGQQHNLVFERGLWFLPDRSMYVYYTPKFWRLAEVTP